MKTAIDPVTALLVFLCIAACAASAYWVDILPVVAFGRAFPRPRQSYRRVAVGSATSL